MKTTLWCGLLLLLTSKLTAQCGAWMALPVAPMPMRVANNAVCEGFIGTARYAYSFGGIDSTLLSSGITRRAFRYDVAANTWDTLPPVPDTLGKIGTAASRIGDTIYVIGGYHVLPNGSEVTSNKVHRFVVSQNVWIADGAPVPVPIDDQVQAVFADSLIVVVTGWSNTTNVNNVQLYNVRTNTWSSATPVPNTGSYKVFGGAGAIQGHTLYYYGGASTGTNFPATTFIRQGVIDPLNPAQIVWSIADTVLNTPAYRAAAVGFRYAALPAAYTPTWFGGSKVSYNYDAYAYNGSGIVQPPQLTVSYAPFTDQNTVCSGSGLPIDHRGAAELGPWASYDYAALLCGGIDSNQVVTNETWLLAFLLSGNPESTAGAPVQLIPNPAASTVLLQRTTTAQPAQVWITDVCGRVWQHTTEITTTAFSFDVSGWPAGIYLVHLHSANELQTIRLVVQPL